MAYFVPYLDTKIIKPSIFLSIAYTGTMIISMTCFSSSGSLNEHISKLCPKNIIFHRKIFQYEQNSTKLRKEMKTVAKVLQKKLNSGNNEIIQIILSSE